MGLLTVIGPSMNENLFSEPSLCVRYFLTMSFARHQSNTSRSMAGKSDLGIYRLEHISLSAGLVVLSVIPRSP